MCYICIVNKLIDIIMSLTISIDTSSSKAKAFIAFVRTLDFIKIHDDDEVFILSDEQKAAIDEGMEQLKAGKSSSHHQVMDETKKRYAGLFQ